MKRLFCIIIGIILFVNLHAQVQQGRVRSAGTPEQKGQPLEGVTVQMHGEYNPVISDSNGSFAVLMFDKRNGDPISIDNIFKIGYELLDDGFLSSNYAFSSKVPIEVVMKSRSAIAAEQAMIEQRAYANAEKVYNRRIAQLDSALAASRITSERRREELLKAQEQYNAFASLVSVMSGRYARIDYDRLEDSEKEISKCIAEGNLIKADSLINLKGNINFRVQECKANFTEIREAEEQLHRATRQFERKKEEFIKLKNNLAEDLYGKYAIFLSRFQLDSACHYILERAELDTTDISNQIQTAAFLSKYSIDYERSDKYIQRAIRQIESQHDVDYPKLAACFHLKGKNYEKFAEYDKARSAYDDALSIYGKSSDDCLSGMMSIYLDLGDLMCRVGNYDAALSAYDEVKNRMEQIKEQNLTGILRRYYNSMADYSRRFMKYDDALNYIASALKICEEEEGVYSTEMAYSLNVKGAIHISQKDYGSAIKCSEKVLEIRRKIYGDKHPEVATAYNNLGSVCDYLKQREQALEYLKKGLEINKEIFGAWHPSIATNYNNIASVLISQKKHAEAVDYLEKSIEIRRTILGEYHETVAVAYNNLANAFYNAGDPMKACEYILKAIVIFEQVYGNNHDKVAVSYANYGMMAGGFDADVALEAFSKARKIYVFNHGEGSRKVAELDFSAGYTFNLSKDYERAYGYLKKADEVYGADGYDSFEEALVLEFLSNIEATTYKNYMHAASYAELALDVYSRVISPECRSAVTLRYKILAYYYTELSEMKKGTARYSVVLKKLKAFDSKCMWQAFVPENLSQEEAKGLAGDYWLVRYNEWDMTSLESLGDVAERYKGKPKDLLLYRDGIFTEVVFDDKPGVNFVCLPIDPELKTSILNKYESR